MSHVKCQLPSYQVLFYIYIYCHFSLESQTIIMREYFKCYIALKIKIEGKKIEEVRTKYKYT